LEQQTGVPTPRTSPFDKIPRPQGDSNILNKRRYINLATSPALDISESKARRRPHNEAAEENITKGADAEKAFTLYPKLPPELEKNIWMFAAQDVKPRLINLGRKYGSIPAILQACHLSRFLAAETYQLLDYKKYDKPNGFTIPINFDIDVVFLPKCMPFEEHYREFTGWFSTPNESHLVVHGMVIRKA
jgi:hypothetical protein